MVFDPEHLTDEENEAIDGFCGASATPREAVISMLARLARAGRAGGRAGASFAKAFDCEIAREQVDKFSKAARKALIFLGQGKRKRGLNNPYCNKPW